MRSKDALSTLSLAILGLISKAPCSGYDLRKLFSSSPIGAFSSSPGAIYPALKRCESNGWLRSDIDSTSVLRPRQVFHLTEKGREVLKNKLTQSVEVDDVIRRREDLILRFAFMDGILNVNEIIRFLEGYVRTMEDYLETLNEHRKILQTTAPRCGILALEQGIESFKSDIGWGRKAILEFHAGMNK